MKRCTFFLGLFFFVFGAFHKDVLAEKISTQAQGISATSQQISSKITSSLSLQECIDIALQNNRYRTASKFAIEIAEAQYQQTLSAFWPQLAVKSTYSVMDQDPNFIFPATNINVPSTTVIVNTPLGPLPVTIPPQSVTVPDQDIKLMDRETLLSSLNLTYPIYTGGLRGAIVKQAAKGLQAAKEEARRTDLQVVYDVRRMYYGAVLGRELVQIGKDALARMEVTLELTENLYKRGSGRVKKTDYLRNKTVVEGLRSAVAMLQANEKIAEAALINTMGLDWNTTIEISETLLSFTPYQADLKDLVGNAYSFNPDWAKLQAGLEAAEAKIKEAKSGHHPKLALFGNLTHIDNAYDAGIATSRNKNSWTVGLGMELPLFNGFRTTNEIKEAYGRLGKLKEQKILLKEGLALQVKHLFIQMTSAQEQKKASEEAAKSSEENRDLNERAYQEELVETKDVIEAQLVESLMKAQYQKALFDHIESQAHLDFVIGKEIAKLIHEGK
jgi:outer membrane protein